MALLTRPPLTVDHDDSSRNGLLYGLTAYGLWGLIPLYFRALRHVAPLEILAHRVVWSCLFLAALIALLRRWKNVTRAVRTGPVLGTLLASTVLIAINWFTYIYAVATDQVLQASLGYFVNPMVNVALGVVFLRERLRGGQLAAIALASVGVLNLGLGAGQLPWIAVTLALSFGLYGLLRKMVAVDGLTGLFVETTALAPLAAGYLALLPWIDPRSAVSSADGATWRLLLSSGVITAVPLLCFTAAARRLRLTTLGLIQYLTPSLQFLLAVLAFGEPFSRTQLMSFACIWTAVALYTADSLRSYRHAMNGERATTIEPATVGCASER